MKKIFQLYPDDFYNNKANESFEKGMDEIINGNYNKANEFFRDAIKLDPKEPKYYFFTGLTLYYFQDDEAINFFEKAAMMKAEEIDFQMWYGITLYNGQRYEEAKRVLLYAYSLDNHNEKVTHYLVKTLNRLGDFQLVIEIIDGNDESGKTTSENFYELGYAHLKEFEFDKSEEFLLKSIQLDSKNVMSYYFLSRVYCKTGEFDNAIKILKKLAEEVESESKLVESNIEAIKMLKSF